MPSAWIEQKTVKDRRKPPSSENGTNYGFIFQPGVPGWRSSNIYVELHRETMHPSVFSLYGVHVEEQAKARISQDQAKPEPSQHEA